VRLLLHSPHPVASDEAFDEGDGAAAAMEYRCVLIKPTITGWTAPPAAPVHSAGPGQLGQKSPEEGRTEGRKARRVRQIAGTGGLCPDGSNVFTRAHTGLVHSEAVLPPGLCWPRMLVFLALLDVALPVSFCMPLRPLRLLPLVSVVSQVLDVATAPPPPITLTSASGTHADSSAPAAAGRTTSPAPGCEEPLQTLLPGTPTTTAPAPADILLSVSLAPGRDNTLGLVVAAGYYDYRWVLLTEDAAEGDAAPPVALSQVARRAGNRMEE